MDPRISYVLQTFRHLYEIPEEVNIIYGGYSGTKSQKVRIQSHAGNFFEKQRKIRPDELVFKEWKNEEIPFLFEDSDEQPIFEMSENEAVLNYDVVAASFYFLSGWQEYTTPKENYVDGRFPYEQSLQYQLNTAHIPWVNYYFDILKTAVERIYDIELSARKGETEFQIAATHDIDSLFSGWFQESYHALRKGDLLAPFRFTLNRIGGPQGDPWFNLLWLNQQVQEMGANATFYFLANSERIGNKKQADYSLADSLLKDQIKTLTDRGSEIGIHGSIGSHLDADMLQEERDQIPAEISGSRFHYLYYDIHHTPKVLQNAGMDHDSTLGFAEQAGFRNAFTHPFYIYDLENNRSTQVLEIPLIIMDATLRQQNYMGLTPQEGLDVSLAILEEVKQFHGAAAILWHNSYFSDFKYAGWGELFFELINCCIDQQGAVVSCSEIMPHFTYQDS